MVGQNYYAELPEGQSEWIKIAPKNETISFDCYAHPKELSNRKYEYHYFIVQLENFVQCVKLYEKPLIHGR